MHSVCRLTEFPAGASAGGLASPPARLQTAPPGSHRVADPLQQLNQLYLSILQSVFVPIKNGICPSCETYFFAARSISQAGSERVGDPQHQLNDATTHMRKRPGILPQIGLEFFCNLFI